MPKKVKKAGDSIQKLDDQFDADIAPIYVQGGNRFNKQGRRSFINEFYSFYRRWVKNE